MQGTSACIAAAEWCQWSATAAGRVRAAARPGQGMLARCQGMCQEETLTLDTVSAAESRAQTVLSCRCFFRHPDPPLLHLLAHHEYEHT